MADWRIDNKLEHPSSWTRLDTTSNSMMEPVGKKLPNDLLRPVHRIGDIRRINLDGIEWEIEMKIISYKSFRSFFITFDTILSVARF